MSRVELQIDVIRNGFDKLQADIRNLENKGISIKVDGGTQSVNQLTNATKQYTTAVTSADRATQSLEGSVIRTRAIYDANGKSLKELVTTTEKGFGQIENVYEKYNKKTKQLKVHHIERINDAKKAAQEEAKSFHERYKLEESYAKMQQALDAEREKQIKASVKNKAALMKEEYAFYKNVGGSVGFADIGMLGDTNQLKSYVNSLEGLEGATVRAAKAKNVAGREFQKFTTEIDKGNGVIEAGEVYIDKLTGETYKMSKGFTEAKIKADELYNNIKKFARWYIIGTFFSKIAGSLRDALKEMKAVDTELITVRKVTDMTAGELQNLTDTAYETAEALGATASAFLNAVSTFSKAGYDEQAESLAELAIKAANVGDTTQEVANQFLLSVDKAYKYQGSIEQLTAVLDGANEIGNQYATDVEHIASGLGLVAPVAAQAHIGIDELTAAIGTITAVTQRSGTEAARALRALVLNIIKDTTTEIEDGVTLTADEIEGLHDLLNVYASDVVKAAEATGKVINPMEAIAALAKSMQDGILTEQKMMGMATELGGKLRTTQLVALIQNWDMYNEMLETYRTSLGSADREYQIYLDSWEAKLNQLSASWTSFVSNIVSTDAIKTALDGIIALVDILNNSVTTTAIAIASMSAAFIGLSKAAKFVGATQIFTDLGKSVKSIFEVDKFTKTATRIKGGFAGIAEAVGKTNLAFIGVATAIAVIAKVYDAWEHQLDNQRAKVENLKDEYEKLYGSESEFAILQGKLASGNITAEEEARLNILKAENEALKEQIRRESEREYEIFKSRFGITDSERAGRTTAHGTFVGSETAFMFDLRSQYNQVQSEAGADYRKEKTELLQLVSAYGQTVNEIKEYREQGRELTPEMIDMVKVYQEMTDRISELNDLYPELIDDTEKLATSVLTIESAIGSLQEPYELLKQAQSDMNELGIVSASTVQKIADKHSGLKKYLVQTEEGYILAENALEKFIAAQRVEYEDALTKAKIAAVQVLNAEGIKADAYNDTTEAILAQLYARKELLVTERTAKMAEHGIGGSWSPLSGGDAVVQQIIALETAIENIAAFNAAYATIAKESGKSSKGGGSSSDKDAYLTYLQAIIKLRESELDLLDAQGANIGTQVSKIKEIQDALHKEAEYLRSTDKYLKGDADTIAEINSLSKEWLNYQEKIVSLQKELQDELNDYVDNEFKRAKEAKEAQIKLLDEEIDRQKQLKDDAEKTNELEEKTNAVLEKRKALQNALNERNVRYYNARTGQWEWGANAKNVADAKKDLEEAEDELAKYRKDLKHEAAIADLEKRKQQINDTYDLLEDSWTKVTDSLQKPTRKISDILSDIARDGTPEMQRQVEAVSKLLEQLGIYINGVTSGQIPNLENIENVGGNLQIGQTTTSASGGNYTQMNYRGSVTTQKGIDLYNQLASGTVSQVVDGNGNTWEYAGNNTVRVYTPSGNTYLADVKGATTSSSSGSSPSGKSSSGGSSSSSSSSSGGSWTSSSEINRIANEHGVDMSVARSMAQANERTGRKVYDRGGILYGIGGIKATTDNEMILPPSITKEMLKPSANKDFQKRLSELNYMYGASQTVPPTLISNMQGGIGKQYNGDIYQYGNITLTKEQARSTSVYDLARLSGKLSIYSN